MIFLRPYIVGSIWLFLLSFSTSLTHSWQNRNDAFGNIYYINIFVIFFGCGVFFLLRGGVDCFITYRFHWHRNIFLFFGFSGMIMGVIGLIIGDGGEDSLVKTLNYHSAFVPVYSFVEIQIGVMTHYFIVVYEELTWKYPNPVPNPTLSSPSTVFPNESMASETFLQASANNKVACEIDLRQSSLEFSPLQTIPEDIIAGALPENHINDDQQGTDQNNDRENFFVEDGKEDGDLEAAASRGFVSQSATVSFCDAPSVINPSDNAADSAPVPSQTDSTIVPYQSHHRRNALAFDGITRRSSILRKNILTHQDMMVKLKRHELVCREMDKLYCLIYQICIWEVLLWLTQLFLELYLQSVNTPTLPATQDGYYCQTPLENTVNSAQFVNDFVFARK